VIKAKSGRVHTCAYCKLPTAEAYGTARGENRADTDG
jgi:hypothetical protein